MLTFLRDHVLCCEEPLKAHKRLMTHTAVDTSEPNIVFVIVLIEALHRTSTLIEARILSDSGMCMYVCYKHAFVCVHGGYVLRLRRCLSITCIILQLRGFDQGHGNRVRAPSELVQGPQLGVRVM